MFSSPKSGARSSWWLLGLMGSLLILVPILAILQYRWIGEVSAAERDRLESSLRISSNRFAQDFFGEVSRLFAGVQLREAFLPSASDLLNLRRTWAENATYPNLLGSLYLLKTEPGQTPELYKVDAESDTLQPVALPEELRNLRPRPGPTFVTMNGTLTVLSPIFRQNPFRRDRDPEVFGRPRGTGPGPRPGSPGRFPEGWTLVELNRDVLFKELVPALVEKHFSHDASAYRIAIVSGGSQPQVLYSSEGTWRAEDIRTPDASLNLWGGPPEPRGRGPFPFPVERFPPSPASSQRWQLLVKHRLGSLETAVEQVRRRNLGISFGILLILGTGVITVLVSSHRAQTLGRLQMEFAAGVSHELRTPLAVIRTAAHNLQSGIIRDDEGVAQYAGMVQDEARRLSEMVDQVLLYSETHSGRKKYELAPVDVNDVINDAIRHLSLDLDNEKYDITTNVAPDLRPVKADAAALKQCIQNLLSNAFKYGKKSDTVQIEVAAKNDVPAGEVQLSVSDNGPGIEEADQRHLFEAFYRGIHVGSNVPGNGLGLHLVKTMMQSQGGRVTFKSSRYNGSCFTLHIPASP